MWLYGSACNEIVTELCVCVCVLYGSVCNEIVTELCVLYGIVCALGKRVLMRFSQNSVCVCVRARMCVCVCVCVCAICYRV